MVEKKIINKWRKILKKKWKKDAKDKVNKLKHGVLTEDEVYEWLTQNKQFEFCQWSWQNSKMLKFI